MPYSPQCCGYGELKMNALIVALTLYAAPVDVAAAAGAPITLNPTTTIEFVAKGTSAAALKKPWTQCARFVKAAELAGMFASCSTADGQTEYVAPVAKAE